MKVSFLSLLSSLRQIIYSAFIVWALAFCVKMVCTNSTCLNGGICVEGVVCACPPGWQNDFVGYYHSQNCSLPSDFVFIFFIVCSVIVPICIGALHYIARNAKKSVRDWKLFYIAWLIVDWVAILTVFVEDGYYVAACVSTSIYACVGSVIPAFIMVRILDSYFKLVPSFPHKIFKVAAGSIVIGWNIIITGIMIAAAVVVRSDVELYNTLIIAWFIIHGLLNVLFLTVFFVFTNKLKQQIESVVSAMQDHEANSRKEATLHAVKRLGGITQMCLGLLPFSFVNIAVGIALIVLDSVPYL